MIVFLQDLFLKDIRLKLFSFILAVLMWLTIHYASMQALPLSPKISPRTFTAVPVILLSAGDDVRQMKVSPQTVSVTVQGAPELIGRLDPNDVRALVDPTGVNVGGGLRKKVEVTVPPGISLVGTRPGQVEVISYGVKRP